MLRAGFLRECAAAKHQGLDALAKRPVARMLIQPHQLIDDHRSQGEQLRPPQALHRTLHPLLKDTFVQAVDGFDGLPAQFVKHFSHLHALIAMEIRNSPCRHQLTVLPVALIPRVWAVVLGIIQHIAHCSWELHQQLGSHLMAAPIRHGQLGGQRHPAHPHGYGQM
jgi:hypothetical protein